MTDKELERRQQYMEMFDRLAEHGIDITHDPEKYWSEYMIWLESELEDTYWG